VKQFKLWSYYLEYGQLPPGNARKEFGVHGVSTFTRPLVDRPCGVACRDAVERVFSVVKTGRDPDHFTVVLPKPVTKGVADQFNQLFSRLLKFEISSEIDYKI